MNNEEIAGTTVLILIILLSVGNIYQADMRDKFKAKAIELKAAEWVVDPRTGETTFQWKEQKTTSHITPLSEK